MKEQWKLYNDGTIHATKKIDPSASKHEKKRMYEYQLIDTYTRGQEELHPRIFLARSPSTIAEPSHWVIAIVLDRLIEMDELGRNIVKHWDVLIHERLPVTKYISRTRMVMKDRCERLIRSLPDRRHMG